MCAEHEITVLKDLFYNTFLPLNSIMLFMRSQAPISIQRFGELLKNTFTKEEFQLRKSKLRSRQQQQDKNSCWKGGKINDAGYWLVNAPDWYEGSPGNKVTRRVKEHILVYCEAHNLSKIPKGQHVQHIDGNKTNNDITNLQLLTNR